jgi:hypothetical protein
MTSSHPSWEALVAHVFEGAPLDDPRHAAGCERCTSSLAWLDRLARGLELASVPEPSAELVDAAWARIRDANARGLEGRLASLAAHAKNELREVMAVLTRDSLALDLAVRGTSLAAPRLLVFETAGFAITISLRDEAERIDLRGQVVPKDSGVTTLAGSVTVSTQDGPRSTALSAFGEFGFERLPRHPLTLSAEIGETRIRLTVDPIGEGD